MRILQDNLLRRSLSQRMLMELRKLSLPFKKKLLLPEFKIQSSFF